MTHPTEPIVHHQEESAGSVGHLREAAGGTSCQGVAPGERPMDQLDETGYKPADRLDAERTLERQEGTERQ